MAADECPHPVIPAADAPPGEWADFYLALGVHVIPVRPGGEKAPALMPGEVAQFRSRYPTAGEQAGWFAGGRNGVALNGGTAESLCPAKLVVLDFECRYGRPAYPEWRARLSPEAAAHLAACPVVETPSGGTHVYVWLDDPQPCGRLAYYAAVGGERPRVKVEVRGSGGYVVAPGSPAACHAANKTYRLVSPGWLATGRRAVTPGEVYFDWLTAAAEVSEAAPPVRNRPAAGSGGAERPAGPPSDDQPGTDFNHRGTWDQAGLFDAEWAWCRQVEPDRGLLTRPGKERGVSASVGMCKSSENGWPLFYCWSTSVTDFEPETPYTRFAVYAVLKCQGDFATAAANLSRLGFGKPPPRITVGGVPIDGEPTDPPAERDGDASDEYDHSAPMLLHVMAQPATAAGLAERMHTTPAEIVAGLAKYVASGRVEVVDGVYRERWSGPASAGPDDFAGYKAVALIHTLSVNGPQTAEQLAAVTGHPADVVRAELAPYVGESVHLRDGVYAIPERERADGVPGGPPPSEPPPEPPPAAEPVLGPVTNYTLVPGEKRPERAPLAACDVVAHLFARTGGWPKAVGGRLFADDGRGGVRWLDDRDGLFAFAREAGERAGVHPAVEWADRLNGGVSRAELVAHVAAVAERFETAAAVPHQPPVPGVYYLSRPADAPRGGDGAAFDRLLAFFAPATPTDRALVRALFLTGVWGGPPGGRPAFAVMPDPADPNKGVGIGKTTLAKLFARLVGGALTFEQDRPNPVSDLKTRLLTNAQGKRVVLLDNLRGKVAAFWPQIEEMVTQPDLSGRAMYVGEGCVPNLLTWVVTNNGATFSRDTASRLVAVRLVRPSASPTWEAEVTAFIDSHRWVIVDDMAAVLARPPAPLTRANRWAAWGQEVLARATGDPDAVMGELEVRQGEADGSGDEEGGVVEAVGRALRPLGLTPESDSVLFRTAAARRLVQDATGVPHGSNAASAYLSELKMDRLKKSDRKGQRFWLWLAPHGTSQPKAVVDFQDTGRAVTSGFFIERPLKAHSEAG